MKQVHTLLLAFLSLSLSAQNTIYVNASASGNNDGTSWENAFNTLDAALTASSDGDEIWMAAGNYTPEDSGLGALSTFMITKSIGIYGGFAGTENNKNERVRDENEVILNGDILGNDTDGDFFTNKGDNVYHIVDVPSSPDVEVTLDRLSFAYGATLADFDDNFEHHLGGGLRSYARTTVNDCTFYQNFSRGGSGVALIGQNANNSRVEGCNFYNNYASEQSAGVLLAGLFEGQVIRSSFTNNTTNRGTIYPIYSNTIIIDSCFVADNTCTDPTGFGAGMFFWQSVNCLLQRTTVRGNNCGNGTGFYVDGRELSEGTPSLTVSACAFENNEAEGYGGGAFYSFKADVEVRDSRFKLNSAGDTGGAIYAGGGSKYMEVSNCIFDENTANGGWGGAVTIHGDTSRMLVENTQFINNTAVTSGGAVVTGFRSIAEFDQCYFEANVGVFGGAAFSQNDSSSMEFFECEFVGNQGDDLGGAISLSSGSQHNIERCRFELNIANGSGGALYVGDPDFTDEDTTLVLIDVCEFVENIAETQGGAVNIDNSSVIVVNSLFRENSTLGAYGGAIMNNGSQEGYALLGLLNNTFYENVASQASGIGQFTDDIGSADAVLQNNILYHTLSSDYAEESGSPMMTSLGGNSVQSTSLSDIFNAMNDTEGLDPMFIDPENGDFCLKDNSPCVNTGIPEGTIPVDFYGNDRVGKIDKGYCENQNVVSSKDLAEVIHGLHVFPNPATDQVQLHLEWPKVESEVMVQAFNAEGKMVFQQSFQPAQAGTTMEVNVAQWNSGVYQIRCSSDRYYSSQTITRL